jgi:hypothetical protein
MQNRIGLKNDIVKREVVFSVNTNYYTGMIESLSNEGLRIMVDSYPHIAEGDDIFLTILCADQENVKKARVVWSDARGFGAKFI